MPTQDEETEEYDHFLTGQIPGIIGVLNLSP
jgi:hypothetical protein